MSQSGFLANSAGRMSSLEPARSEARVSTMAAAPRCLVLAESSSLRLLIRQILSLEGWDAVEQEEAGAPSYQAVVADLDCFRWPAESVSGVVARAMRGGLPVLALTGQDLTPPQYAALGRPRLLAKPFELAAFLQVLHSWTPRVASGA